MLFNSFEFLFFFVVVYLIYLRLNHKAQNLFLLGASYLFYSFWDWRFLSLIMLSTVIDYFIGRKIYHAKDERHHKLYVLISLISNLGILGIFKYYNFFTDSLQTLMGNFDITLSIPTMNIILPVGISFYTFQTLSYTIDIYRGKLKPSHSFLDFALFVSFFPQLVAGPIERAVKLLPQVEKERKISVKQIENGLFFIIRGYFKKVVLADNLAPFAASLFLNPEDSSGLEVLLKVYAFAFQIYGDFSGYTDIARGISNLLGFNLMENFRRPYFAMNPSDFWRRWHISLSTWLRDYLYISLGGSRGSVNKTYRNLTLTMLLGGVWHGAAWNFVAWGFYHGFLLIFHRLLGPFIKNCPSNKTMSVLKIIIFFQFTCIGWVLFAVHSLGDFLIILQRLVIPTFKGGATCLATLIMFALPLLVIEYLEEQKGISNIWQAVSLKTKKTIFVTATVVIIISGEMSPNAFIYFQF